MNHIIIHTTTADHTRLLKSADHRQYAPENRYAWDVPEYKTSGIACGVAKRLLKTEAWIPGQSFGGFEIAQSEYTGLWTLFFRRH